MSDWSLPDLAKKMKDIDFAMLGTRTEGGALASRPMSNNREVEYDGDSFFFTYARFRTVGDIESDPNVSLAFQGSKGLLGTPPLFIAVEGTGEVIRDKGEFKAHWHAELNRWFEQGVDTPGMVLIKVHAKRIHYWSGKDEGEIKL
ncbi:pyridoxamine 5'-phosphate oxidase family protein [Aurantimonas sp. MSK8Z-1]|uniref:pyridoxamine 5'-phosphate oxidase family protein n=1 Tax=Mangrovibrevibacter kandeliae TaxID=2968473 RepID=UPI0021184C86|nr:pyridoxamine 5'-phosphate oxidase family protein [Aurantimonas sp. MSK8Z-1]MCW4115511.1 pyridoxamine 5'-phosphate oxidase family protein [Aurantimonas sp. MSK8Z-1]